MTTNNPASDMGRELKMIAFYRTHPVIAAKDLLRVDLAVPQQAILRDMWFKNFVLVTAGRGTGKCVSGDTLIYTSNGVLAIESMGSKLNPISDLDTTIHGINGQEHTSKWYYDGIRETNDITTAFGFDIKATDEHKLVVWNSYAELEWKKSSDIRVGDRVVISRGANLWSSTDVCTKDEATLMGLLIGDGCFRCNKNLLGFTNGDREVRDIYTALGTSIFGYPPGHVETENRCDNLNYYHRDVWEKLTSLGIKNNTLSGDKEIPNSVMRSSKEVVVCFLRGLFEADGGVERDSFVSYCTKSIKLAKQVQMLLLNMGIVSSRRTKHVNYKGSKRPFEVIEITSENVDSYYNIIGFLSSRKNKSLLLAQGKKRNQNLDTVPNLEELFRKMWDRTRGTLSCTQRDIYKKYKNGYNNPTYSSLRQCIELYPFSDECKSSLIKIVEDNYLITSVCSISRGLNEVYDLVVPGTHSFVGNGFVNHNTFLNSVFACLWALLYPGQKVGLLAPSFRQAKMLFAEVEKRWHMAPLLQEATSRRPITASDRCYLEFRQAGFAAGSMIEAVPLGDGCLAPNTYITTDSGFTTFRNLIPVADVSKDEQVFEDRNLVWSPQGFLTSDEKYYNGIRPTIKVTTGSGRVVEGTCNHELKVSNGANFIWRRLDQLVVGDSLLLDTTPRWHSGTIEDDEDSCYALGLLLGDGCWTNKYRISFATKDYFLAGSLKKVFPRMYGVSDGVHYYIDGISIRSAWLSGWGIGFLYTKDKKIPQKALRAEKHKMAAIISGLFDTDGHVQISESKDGVGITVGFTNTSESLVDQLQYILTHFGINSYKTSRERNVKWNTCFELLVTGKDAVIFSNEIGFRLKRKQCLLESAINKKTRFFNAGDYIPNIKEEALVLREALDLKSTSLTVSEKSLIRPSVLSTMRSISRNRLCLLLKAAGQCGVSSSLSLFSNANIRFDTVVSTVGSEAQTYDIHVPKEHVYTASGFVSHNSKIRGARYYAILADEFAQIPEDIFNTVILPMGATVADPMANVHRIAKQKALIKSGHATAADFGKRQDNKVIVTSSAFYQFNHMYQTMINYEEAIRRGEDQYAVHTVSFRDMPEGFLSEENLRNSQLKLSRIEFRMEYEAIWEADSSGVFKASLISKCQSNANHSISIKGNSGSEYVLGVDPARASDAFALCLIEIGPINKVVAAWEYYQNVFPKMSQTIIDICNTYNVVAVHMDAGAGGGGLAMKDLLFEEERWGSGLRLVDVDEEDHKHLPGRHILHMFQPSPRANAEAVFASLNLMEKDLLSLPQRPQPKTTSVEAMSELEEAEGIYETVVKMTRQLMLIEVSESRSGMAHFDVPTGGGHAAQKKDLFTSFILASKMAYDLMLSEDESSGILEVGIVSKRKSFQIPTTKEQLSDSLVVSQVPMNSWPFKKKFKPGL